MAHKVEELPVFQDAQKFCDAVTEILKTSRVRRNSKGWEQIAEASASVLANLDEGFEQESDDGFAKHVYYSKGSLEEVMRRLRQCARQRLIDPAAVERLEPMADSVGRQMGGFIKYLKRSSFKDRGRFRLEQPAKNAQSHE